MPSLSDKLKSLGVNVGAKNISPPVKNRFPIEEVIDGNFQETAFGQTFVVETYYPIRHQQGLKGIEINASLDLIAEWANEPRIKQIKSDEFVFIDTETSGLAGGTGTYAFLIGAARFETDGFHLAQFFLQDPIEEVAQLVALSEFLGTREGLVTFNGKSFDVPLLNSRYIINGDVSPFRLAAHIDLLPLARRLWRDRLPSRRLGALEEQILGFQRTGEDVPGWLVPTLYFDYLRSGDARPLRGVFYHNAMDIVSMAALLNHITTLLEEPLDGSVTNGTDLVAMGKFFQGLGYLDRAAELYARALENALPTDAWRRAVYQWSFMEKRRENLYIAIELWEQAAADEEIFAHIELAKYFEHRQKDFSQAIFWTQTALDIVKTDNYSRIDRQQLLPEIEHRLARLNRKISRNNITD